MDELMAKYIETFGEGFPMFQIGRTRSEDETKAIIEECIAKRKDAYELGYVKDDIDILY